jgi:hypothetical protein
MAKWQLLRALTYTIVLREFCRHHLIPNLLAGVPKRRPYCSSDTTFFDYFVPSGSVLAVEALAVPGSEDTRMMVEDRIAFPVLALRT